MIGKLKPYPAMKGSGVPWLGEVPAHWGVEPIARVGQLFKGRGGSKEDEEQVGVPCVRYGDLYKVDSFRFDDKLLLIAEDGANLNLRNLPLAIVARGKFWVNNHAHILKPKRGNLEYLAALMEALDYRPWISGAAQPKLTQDRLMSITIAVPPMAEQDRIMKWLDGETASFGVAIQRAHRELDFLREYRTRLIADVVTGKLDVREVAAGLPEEGEEPEPLEEAVTNTDEEGAGNDDDEVGEEASA